MNWLGLIKLILPIIIELIGNLGEKDECPDGVCPPVEEDLRSLQVELDEPRIQVSTSQFFECFDFARFFGALSEVIAVLRDAFNGVCPPESSTADVTETD